LETLFFLFQTFYHFDDKKRQYLKRFTFSFFQTFFYHFDDKKKRQLLKKDVLAPQPWMVILLLTQNTNTWQEPSASLIRANRTPSCMRMVPYPFGVWYGLWVIRASRLPLFLKKKKDRYWRSLYNQVVCLWKVRAIQDINSSRRKAG